jgi:glycosyltransferase involved in cell wall biosynthesis
MMGRMHRVKGVDFLLKAWQMIQQGNERNGNGRNGMRPSMEGPALSGLVVRERNGMRPSREGPAFDLLIAGDGPEYEHYQTLAGELGVSSTVRFLGAVTESQKASLYRGAYAFTCPSHMEHFGIVNIEAMAAGIPVISSQVGGIPDIVIPSHNGLLVPDADSPALAEALWKVLSNPSYRYHLAAGAVQSRDRYDWSQVAQEYENLYQEIQSRG